MNDVDTYIKEIIEERKPSPGRVMAHLKVIRCGVVCDKWVMFSEEEWERVKEQGHYIA